MNSILYFKLSGLHFLYGIGKTCFWFIHFQSHGLCGFFINVLSLLLVRVNRWHFSCKTSVLVLSLFYKHAADSSTFIPFPNKKIESNKINRNCSQGPIISLSTGSRTAELNCSCTVYAQIFTRPLVCHFSSYLVVGSDCLLLLFSLVVIILFLVKCGQVKRCAEMSRKLRFFKDQIHKAGLMPSPHPVSQPDIELEELEVRFFLSSFSPSHS